MLSKIVKLRLDCAKIFLTHQTRVDDLPSGCLTLAVRMRKEMQSKLTGSGGHNLSKQFTMRKMKTNATSGCEAV